MIIKIYHYFVFIIILIFFFIVVQGQYDSYLIKKSKEMDNLITDHVCFLEDCDNTYVFQKSPDQTNITSKIESSANLTSN